MGVEAPARDAARQPAAGPPRALPPGPRLPAAVQTVRLVRSPVPFFEACRRRFGGTFTVRVLRAGRLVFISDPPSLKRLFGADRVNAVAPGRNIVLRPLLGPGSLLLQEGDEHMRRRRLMLPAFHGERMRAYRAVMEDAAEREVSTWPLREPLALHPRMQAITLEVILRAVFGVEDDARREGLRSRLLELLAVTQSPGAIVLTTEGLPRLGRYRRFAGTVGEVDAMLAEQIAERRADPRLDEREDILSMLVGARFDDGSAISDREVRDQLMTLLLAGHETTATALAWSFDLLLRSPAAMARLRAELAEDDGHEYLDAVVEEALRLRPVVPFVGRELHQADELGGYALPVGSVVMPAIYLTHTRPDVFEDPYAFRPERFLGAGPETYSWIPFGGGTRRCIGAAFAQFEMRVVLRTILGRVELRAATDAAEVPVRRNVTLAPRRGTRAVVEARR